MTDFEIMLGELGWRKKDLVDRLGVHPNTVTQWASGAPKYAVAYLEACLAIKRAKDGLTGLVDPAPYGERGKK